LEKRKEQVEEIETLGGKGFGVNFFIHNTKSLSFGVTQKLYWGRVYMNFSNSIYIVIIFLK